MCSAFGGGKYGHSRLGSGAGQDLYFLMFISCVLEKSIPPVIELLQFHPRTLFVVGKHIRTRRGLCGKRATANCVGVEPGLAAAGLLLLF
jgi:hypothetical protein